jgi:hypothetical protein
MPANSHARLKPFLISTRLTPVRALEKTGPPRPPLDDLQQFRADARRHRDDARLLVLTLHNYQMVWKHFHVLPVDVEEDRRIAEVDMLNLKA